MCVLAKKIGDKKDLALLLVRVGLGLIFLMHGIGKLQGGVDGFSSFLGILGFPVPLFFGWLVALVETVGGAALLLGIGSRWAAALLSVVMIVAIIKVKWSIGLIASLGSQGVGMEFDIALLVGLLSILLQGPGLYSIELKQFKKELS